MSNHDILQTEFESDVPPCETCSMRNHCAVNNDKCSQMKIWESTGYIKLCKSRQPKILKKQQGKIKPKKPKAITMREWLTLPLAEVIV